MDRTEPVGQTSLDVAIDDLTHDGMGIARVQGEVIFIAGALPGDRVRLRITGRRRRQRFGQLQAILSASPHRRKPPCILADHCGGCSLQPLADAAQQAWKQRHVEQCLKRVASLEIAVRPLLASQAQLGYRNRAVIPLERTEDGRLRAGFYRRGSHRIVNMNHCPVLDPRLDALIAPLKADLEASDWPIDRHGQGLRHLALRIGERSGELLITLIASDADLPGLADMAAHWMGRWPDLAGVCLNLQPEPHNVLFGQDTRTVAGRGWLLERFADLDLHIAANTFFQIHTSQAERVIPSLLEALGPAEGRLIDAYCGIGTFGLALAAQGWQVTGLELHPAAVRLASLNANLNGLQARAQFQAAAVADALDQQLEQGLVSAVLLDPPRKGLDRTVLASLNNRVVPRVAYLSCDPGTLARDLALLCGPDGAYSCDWVQPVDFFPNTSHVECLAALRRR